MKLKHPSIVIPTDAPFKHDQLERERYGRLLTDLLPSVEDPFVLSVEAGWGHGKTTFLRMWSQQLQNNDYVCLTYNAWENDFAGDPLISLVGEITNGAKTFLGKSSAVSKHLDQFKNAGVEIAKRSLPVATKILTAGLLDLDQITEKTLGDTVERLIKEKFDEYDSTKKSLDTFRASLSQLVADVEKKGKKVPVILIVDELDRCKPTYAVALLERLKHLFNVPKMMFVLGIDKDQLEESIKGVYGHDCDAKRYLRRFIDMEYLLPEPNHEQFAKFLSSRHGFEEGFSRMSGTSNSHFVWTFSNFAKFYELRLRDQEMAFSTLVVAWRTLKTGENVNAFIAGFLIALRVGDRKTYTKLVSGEMSILRYIEDLKKASGRKLLFGSNTYGNALEAFLISYFGSSTEIESSLQTIRGAASGAGAPEEATQRHRIMFPILQEVEEGRRRALDRFARKLNNSDYLISPNS